MSDRLNEAQRKAVMHGEGPMLVLAGPGSGKTFTITNRISNLITHFEVPPQNILVITFTREAAMNMQRRFLASHNRISPVNFGTFHAIFYQMLIKSGCRQADAILKDSDKKHLMIPLLKDYIKATGQSSIPGNDVLSEDAGKCLAAISYYKNTANLEKATKLVEEPYRQGFEQLFTQYEEKRAATGKMDFDDMLYLCLKLLQENKSVLGFWQERFQYILIDEFQDINPMQYKVIRLLAGDKANLFVVGDDDQSIYGFRGSEPSLMKRFLEDYPGCEQVLLDRNYRSRPQIVKASLKVISENKNRFTKELKAAKEEGSEQEVSYISVKSHVDKGEEYQYLIECLASLSEGQMKEAAVLFRTNSQMQGFASRLLKAGIPYVMKEKGSCIYDHFVMQDISAFFKVADGDLRRSQFLRIMNKPYRGISREALEKEIVTFEEIRAYYRKYAYPEELPWLLIQLGELEDGLKRLRKLKPYLAISYIRKGMGYEAYLRRKAGTDPAKLSEWMEILELASEDLKGFSNTREWLEYQEIFRQEMEKGTDKRSVRGDNNQQVGLQNSGQSGVRLMTVHASKGLEFDRVWIPDVNEGTFPYGHMQSEETVEEERRMLYVAMTRAKEYLELTFVTGTKERPRLMSRFLNPVVQKQAWSKML